MTSEPKMNSLTLELVSMFVLRKITTVFFTAKHKNCKDLNSFLVCYLLFEIIYFRIYKSLLIMYTLKLLNIFVISNLIV